MTSHFTHFQTQQNIGRAYRILAVFKQNKAQIRRVWACDQQFDGLRAAFSLNAQKSGERASLRIAAASLQKQLDGMCKDNTFNTLWGARTEKAPGPNFNADEFAILCENLSKFGTQFAGRLQDDKVKGLINDLCKGLRVPPAKGNAPKP